MFKAKILRKPLVSLVIIVKSFSFTIIVNKNSSMNNSLDLDIQNYSIKDLLNFFRFKSLNSLTPSDIELRETEIRELLMTTGHVDKKFKRDLFFFLDTAKNILLLSISPTKQNDTPPLKTNLDSSSDNIRIASMPPRTDELNIRTETPYVFSSNSDYFAGHINPLKTRILSKYVNVDTRFRDSIHSNPADFFISFPHKIQKVVSMQLTSIELPLNFYNISNKYSNHYFSITIVSNFGTYDISISIPNSNYHINDLIDTINSQISLSLSSTSIDLSFNRDLNSNLTGTAKVYVNANGTSGNIVSNLTLNFPSDSIGTILGFLHTNYTGNTHYVSDTIPNINRTRYLYLAIDDFNNSVNNYFESAFQKSVLSPNIIARLSLSHTNAFDVFVGNDINMINEPRKFFGPVDIQKLHIQLFDDSGRIIDLNNSNYSICLAFKIIYDL